MELCSFILSFQTFIVMIRCSNGSCHEVSDSTKETKKDKEQTTQREASGDMMPSSYPYCNAFVRYLNIASPKETKLSHIPACFERSVLYCCIVTLEHDFILIAVK